MAYKQEYITVHAYDTPQADFETESVDGNGLAILMPTICSITEELNGTYELYMEHPIDAEGRWKLLEVDNIIKADGQLFRIKNRRTKMTANGEKVRVVDALHIWYDLAGKNCPSYTADHYAAYWFVQNLNTILNDSSKKDSWYYLYDDHGWYKQYDFFGEVGEGSERRSRFTTNLGDTFGYARIEPANIVSAVIGSESSFVNVFSKEENGVTITPELYRNNFMWSLNWRKQDAQDDAFNITHKIDMIDVDENYDTSNFYTHLHVYDNYGHFMGENISGWDAQAKGEHVPHQPKVKIVKFQYNADEIRGDLWQRFQQDFWRYFRSITKPRLTIRCNYAELSDADLYKDYLQAKHCNVGDSGTVYCEDLGISQVMKVIRKKYDLINKNKVEITFGSKLASITSPDYMSQTINNSKFTNANYFSLVEDKN